MMRYYISSAELSAKNLAGIPHIAMISLKVEASFKGGIRRKQKKRRWMRRTLLTFSRCKFVFMRLPWSPA